MYSSRETRYVGADDKLSVAAGESIEVNLPITPTEQSGAVISALPVTLHYSIGDRNWTRVGGDDPTPG